MAVDGGALRLIALLVLATAHAARAAEYGYHEEAVHYDGVELLRRLSNHGVPDDVPAEFDCEARYLAYNVSLKTQPERAPLKSVWDALQLTTLCHKTFDFSARDADSYGNPARPTRSLTAVDYRVYVSYSLGDDATQDPTNVRSPFRSIHQALAHTRQHRQQASNAAGVATVGIVLRAGVYYLNSTLEINAQDSSTVIESYPGETAVISGGQPLSPVWKAYNVSQGPKMVIKQGADNVWGLVPGGPGTNTSTITYMGTFATSDECQQLCKYGSCYAWTWHEKDATGWSQGCYLHSDRWWSPHVSTTDTSGYWDEGPNVYISEMGSEEGAPQRLQLGLLIADSAADAAAGNFRHANRARFPNIVSPESDLFPAGWVPGAVDWAEPANLGNSTYITVGKPTYDLNPLYENFRIGTGGPCSIFSPPESYWCSDQVGGGGAEQFVSPSGVTFDSAMLPRGGDYDAGLFAQTAVLHTWRPGHWSSWMFQFADFDPATLSGKFSRGGFQGARGASKGAEWWLDNVFEELDFPNEYFYNPITAQLFYFHNGTGAPPEDLQFVAANLKTLVSITGSMDDPVKNFTIQNVVLTGAAITYMDPHGVPSGGDWALQRSGAVFVEGASNLTVRDCLFKNLDGNALFLSGFVRDSLISGNEFTLIGDSAMAAWGYTNLIDGTSGEQPRHNTIESNFIHEIGLYQKQASCWFQAKSAQTRLSKNICFNGPRAGVNFNDGFGGANVMEDNVLFNLCRESSDHAPFNSWDRQPFLTDVPNPEVPTVYPAVNQVFHNFLLCNYGSSLCLDNDDGSSYYHHHDNYLIYGGHKTNFGGHDKISSNNYNIYPRVYKFTCFGLFQNTINVTIADAYLNCTCVLRGVDKEYMYYIQPACDVTKPQTLSFRTGGNVVYTPTGEATVEVCGKNMTSQEWFKLGLDSGTVVKTSPDVGTIIGWGKDLFGIE